MNKDFLKYVEVSKGVSIGVPVELTPAEVDARVEKYRKSLIDTVPKTFQPAFYGHSKPKRG